MILDSNIIIYSINPEFGALRNYLQINVNSIHVSLISRVEVLGYHRLTISEQSQFDEFFRPIVVLPITNEVVTEAIRLRQQRKRSSGDSIIAATALLHNLPLLTHNVGDFTDIDGLQVISMRTVL